MVVGAASARCETQILPADATEAALRRALLVWIRTGLFFMLLPGTLLGVWNLVRISASRSGAGMAPAWLQAHGHAQIFGWIGSFILGIGFYSLSRMGPIAGTAARRVWTSWGLWTAGVALHWAAGAYSWQWRALLPGSAALEVAGFGVFFATVRSHRPASGGRAPIWVKIVAVSTAGFLASLLALLAAGAWLAWRGVGPAVPADIEPRLLAGFLWAFLIPSIWGFNARWLPAAGGFAASRGRMLAAAAALAVAAVAAAGFGWTAGFAGAALAAALAGAAALRVFGRRPQSGVLPAGFVRLSHAWLLAGGALGVWAAFQDHAGGLWGASRHAITVGFISAMVFLVGQKILPEFCGVRPLYSARLGTAALALLNLGCAMRVAGEPGAYEFHVAAFWHVLPCSALIEMTAFTLFAANLLLTFRAPARRVAA